jgi:glycine betaine catabolism A
VLPRWLAALDVAMLRRARRVAWEVDANWKLLVENFQESHHFPTVHPALEALTPWRGSRSVRGAPGWLGGEMRLRDGADTVSTTGLLRDRLRIVPGSARRVVRDAWVAPNLLTSLQPDYLLTYRLHPMAPARTRVVGEVYVHRSTPDDAGMDEVFAFWDRTNAEDRAICERQQQGMASRWPGGAYAESEDGARAFDRWVAQGVRDATGGVR